MRAEFGDYQTPDRLATEVCLLLAQRGVAPVSVLEPTCGRGAFLSAALQTFPSLLVARGLDRNASHVQAAAEALRSDARVSVRTGDFFHFEWSSELSRLPDPLLVVGNPPWVTNSAIGALGGANLPSKGNVDGLRGIEALTGRSNFDISEWMLRESLNWLEGRNGTVALLCKTTVARKVLTFAWSKQLHTHSASIHRLDALRDFGVSVDACLLVVSFAPEASSTECEVFESLSSPRPSSQFGLRDGRLVCNPEAYARRRHLYSDGLIGWRSGIKHDCSRVFELESRCGALTNGLGEAVEIEREVVFPLLKSSDVAGSRVPTRWILIPHRSMSESPSELERRAPAAWRYLGTHAEVLGRRASSIYRNRPPFSIFGVGPYSFAPWKVAISGLYKRLSFSLVGPHDGRAVLFDDTCYFFPCDSEEEATLLHRLVSSAQATELWSSLVFWDSKRPITAKLLNALDLAELARSEGCWSDVTKRIAERQMTQYSASTYQPMLFREAAL